MIEILFTAFLVGLIFAPLGCFVLWKRYVYYGDGLAHSSMLATVISVIMGLPIFYAGVINTIFFAIIVFKLKNRSGNSAAIGLVSSFMISLAIILANIFSGQFSLEHLLFGDIFGTTIQDIILLIIIFIITSSFILLNYKKLILSSLNKEIAYSKGIKVQVLEFLFLTILSFAIISTVKIVGALLITSIILIPAMIARLVSNSPLMMIVVSVFFAQLMNVLGILLSRFADIPFGPVIILCGCVIYILIMIFQNRALLHK